MKAFIKTPIGNKASKMAVAGCCSAVGNWFNQFVSHKIANQKSAEPKQFKPNYKAIGSAFAVNSIWEVTISAWFGSVNGLAFVDQKKAGIKLPLETRVKKTAKHAFIDATMFHPAAWVMTGMAQKALREGKPLNPREALENSLAKRPTLYQDMLVRYCWKAFAYNTIPGKIQSYCGNLFSMSYGIAKVCFFFVIFLNSCINYNFFIFFSANQQDVHRLRVANKSL